MYTKDDITAAAQDAHMSLLKLQSVILGAANTSEQHQDEQGLRRDQLLVELGQVDALVQLAGTIARLHVSLI